MGFLVGNDFIPHLPHFHINKGALPLLYAAYTDVLPTLDGYINENGKLNMMRFQKFMARLAQIDYDNFNDIYADVKWLEERHGRKQLAGAPAAAASKTVSTSNVRSSDTLNFLLAKSAEVEDMLGDGNGDGDENGEATTTDEDLEDLADNEDSDDEDKDSDDEEEEDDDEDGESEDEDDEFDEEKQFQAEFKAHKRNYYMDKLEYDEVDR